MKSYFAYIRVSTVKQGEHGSSLQEQRDAIQAYAARHDLTIAEWFEERETAAKQGRTQFKRMLGLLKSGKAPGVIFHKIDRGARNLKDWSVIQELTERAIDVRFVHETIDMTSNEGKLTGDFLAVIAAHYIRNLRDEVKKGIQGRLKQGLYPFQAPFGYLNQGGGKPKVPDPIRAPYVQLAFELYATGCYSLMQLRDELNGRGCRTTTGKLLTKNCLHNLLRNPFYAGLIALGTGETFPGVHEALVSMQAFKHVQRTLQGKASSTNVRHIFTYRRLVRCQSCHRSLTGERQKGHVYYRCHTRTCRCTSLREEAIDRAVADCLAPFKFTDPEIADMLAMLDEIAAKLQNGATAQLKSHRLRLESNQERQARLLDAFLDRTIDKSRYEAKRRELLTEQKLIEEALSRDNIQDARRTASEMFELLTTLSLSYKISNPNEKREMLKIVTSNLLATQKYVAVELHYPYSKASKILSVQFGGPSGGKLRTGVSSQRRAPLQAFVEFVWEYSSRQCEREHDGKNGQGVSEAAWHHHCP